MYRFDEAAHVHYLDDKRLNGTTTVISETLSKPLTWWASSMACAEFGWKDPKKNSEEECDRAAYEKLIEISRMDLASYQRLLGKAYRAHADNLDKAADKGTDLHDLVEQWIKSDMGINPPQLFVDDRIRPFVEWAKRNVNKFLWAEACHYSKDLWVGGKSDMGYIDKDGKCVIGDIKSSRDAYLSHFIQAGAYHTQIAENGLWGDVDGFKFNPPNIDYYAIFPMGKKDFKEPEVDYRTAMYRDAFCSLLQVYKTKTAFDNKEAYRA